MRLILRALILPVLVLAAAPAAAQDLRYTSETDVEFGGALGTLMRLVPGDSKTTETTYVKGARLRLDTDDAASVLHDVAAGRVTSLDHPGRTYTSFDLEDVARMSERMATSMREGAEAEDVALRDEDGVERGEVRITVETDETGERREVQGLDARRVILTLSFEGEIEVPEEEGGTGEREDAGTLVILTDLWLAEPFPEMRALAEAQAELAAEMGEAARASGQAWQELLASNPDVEVAMERQAAELESLEGMAVETSSYLVGVPPGLELDRDAALAWAQKSLSSQVAGGAAAAAKESVANAARNLGGRLGGMFGRGRPEEPEEEEAAAPPAQSVLFRVRTAITEVERTTLPDDLFAIPAGYVERPLEAGE